MVADITRAELRPPSSPRCAMTKTAAPAARSAGAAVAKVTIGVPAGMVIFFSWPLS